MQLARNRGVPGPAMVDVLMNRDTGIASLNRYFAWGSELRPWPGELEYLGWAAYGRQNSGSDTRVKSVTDNTYSYARTRR